MIHIWLAVLLLVLADTAGDILVTRGMKQVGKVTTLNPQELSKVVRRAITNLNLCLGILSSAFAFFMLLALLSWTDLSFVVPATALVYVFSTLGARYILKERVTPARWVGILFISVGVMLILSTANQDIYNKTKNCKPIGQNTKARIDIKCNRPPG